MTFVIPPVVPPGSVGPGPQPALPSPDGQLLLRPWRPEDAPVLVAAFRDPEIRRWHLRQVTSPREAAEWIEDAAASWRAEGAAQWLVTAAGTGTALGRVCLRDMDLRHGLAEAGYWMLPEARGAGVASRALATVTHWALGTLGLHRLELMHSVHNAPSCRVAERCGYAAEGTLRSALRHADGWHDMHAHARVRNVAAGVAAGPSGPGQAGPSFTPR